MVVNHRCTVVAKMVSQMQRALFLKAAQLYLNPNVIYLQLPGLVTITQQCGFMMYVMEAAVDFGMEVSPSDTIS